MTDNELTAYDDLYTEIKETLLKHCLLSDSRHMPQSILQW